MKLYCFEESIISTQRKFILKTESEDPMYVPVTYYLIERNGEYLLCDMGYNRKAYANIRDYLPEIICDAYPPKLEDEKWVVNGVKKAGLKIEDIKYVLLSHLHIDHAGNVGAFPNATYVVQKKERVYAKNPNEQMKPMYLEDDFDKDVKWLEIDGEANPQYDLFGDGSVVLYYTPGHCPGHQSLMLTFDNGEKIMLTGDACYSNETIDHNIPSAVMHEPEKYMENIEMFRQMKKDGILVMVGHDPEQWKDTKKFPEFYGDK